MRRALWRSSLPEGTSGVQRREVPRAQGRLCGRYRDAFHAQPSSWTPQCNVNIAAVS
jgi:hypothetical protein